MLKKYNKYIFFILFIIFVCNPVFSQIEYSGILHGLSFDGNYDIPYLLMNSDFIVQTDTFYKKQQTNENYKIDFFAYTIPVDINPLKNGKWNQVDTHTRIWRLGITSPSATSLGVTFDPFILTPGVKVFIYTPRGKIRSGAYTFRNNKTTGLLSVTSLPGDSIIIELQLQASSKEYGQFGISTVSVGFEEDISEKSNEDEWFGRSAECHIDINCIDNPDIQLQKYAVCRLIIERTDGRIRCTGTLLNNASENGLPYVLTAGHCVNDMYAAHHTMIYFNYESPYCDGPDGNIKSISGSFLKSRAETMDFSLIELTEKPPVDYYPVYSGWDASGNYFDYSYSIHHPEGDVKKFANDSDWIQTGSFLNFDPGTHWLINDYEIGTTEAGSSGGPLFDSNNRLVGTLSGGGLQCAEPINDCYQKLSDTWDSYPEEDNQLKVWLDPENTGTLVLNNLEPYHGLMEILSNILLDDVLEVIPCENGWGYISGHNSLLSTTYAEHFYRNGSKYIYAINLYAAKAHAADEGSSIKLLIWEGGDIPEQLIFEKELYLFELIDEYENYIRLDTLILVDRDFFVGYSLNYPEPSDTFALYTVIHDDYEKNSSFVWRENDWGFLTDGKENYSASLAISPLVLDYYPIIDAGFGEYPFDEVTIYPNPTYDILQILLKNKPEGYVILSVYDLMGNILHKEKIFQPESNFQFETNVIFKQGIFILKIEYDDKIATRKFVKL